MTSIKKLTPLLAFALLASNSAQAGFCDNIGSTHKIDNIHLYGGRAYMKFSPNLGEGGDAQSCNRSEVTFDLNDINLRTMYPLIMAAMVANKDVTFTYCGGCVTHGYTGVANSVTVVTGIIVSK
jgi:hypothetical protein